MILFGHWGRIDGRETGSRMVERDAKSGRFLAGNKASPGRKRRATEAEYLEAMNAAVSVEAWGAATRKMLVLALQGDVAAYKSLLPYFAGVPIQRLQISSADAQILADVIEKLKTHGLSAGELFNAMLAELSQAEVKTHEPE